MPNEFPLPDGLQHLIEKRSERTRRRKNPHDEPDFDDDQPRGADRRKANKERRGGNNKRRNQLSDEDDD